MNLIEHTIKKYKTGIEIMKAKNADYSGQKDKNGLLNFQRSAEIANIKVTQGILVRLMDKMARIGNLLETEAEIKEETISDTILDAINYLAILDYAIQEESAEQKSS